MAVVSRNSFAEQYCKENGIKIVYNEVPVIKG